MEHKKYAEIRKKKNFLHLYYKEEGGVLGEQDFKGAFPLFCKLADGDDYKKSLLKVVNFLDKKHNFSKK